MNIRLENILRVIAGFFMLLVVWILVKPLKIKRLVSNPNPASDYAEAVKRITTLQQADTRFSAVPG